MKRTVQRFITGLILMMALVPMAIAQIPAGNQWVLQSSGQPFWKFPVAHTGIYRIDSAALAQAGVISYPGFDPRKIRIYRNGEEVALYIQGEQDGAFNSGDFIEFFGRRNDATADRHFFADTAWMVNRYYSLYTDTSCYFLTLTPNFNNARISAETDVTFSSFTPAETWFWSKVSFEPAGTYALGGLNGEDFSKDSRYMDGEGWVDFPFGIDANLTNPREVNLQTFGAYISGPASILTFAIVGRSRYIFKHPAYPGKSHHVKVAIQGVTNPLDDFTYYGYQVAKRTVQFPSNMLSTGFSTKFLFSAVDDMSTNPPQDATRIDRNSIAYIDLTFPHGTNLGNATEKWLYIPDHSQKTKTYLALTNLNVASGTPILYDLTNNKRITVSSTGSTREMLIPNSPAGGNPNKECYLTSEATIRSVTTLYQLSSGGTFHDYNTVFQQQKPDYLIITHPSLQQAAQQYAQYRQTSGYPTLYQPVVIDIEGLYEQFSFGIRNNPLAIEQFLTFLNKNQLLPNTIFIIGKGYATLHSRKDTATFRKSLVPGWGYPATDNLYLIRLSPHPDSATIGRLAATSPAEVFAYLDKVRQYEDTLRMRNEMWMKRIIHLGGGNTSWEQSLIKAHLSKWENVIEGPSFGGEVTTFLKTTTDPIEILKSQHLKNLINGGVSMMSFFGHGSASGFDISTDEVNTYSNEGRYPLVVASSCYSGDLFNKTFTKSEEFVLTPKKGAIAYLGSSNYSTINVLEEINDTLYHYIANAGYGKPLGHLVFSALKPLGNNPNSFYHLTSYHQTTLHGDPAIVLSVQNMPDYRLSPNQIFFTPSNVTNESDSFRIHVISLNAGKAITDSFAVSVRRTFPDKSIHDTLLFYPSTFYSDTFAISLPVNRAKGIGLNIFEVMLDASLAISESDESNNTAQVPLYIKASDLFPVYPYPFAVIPDPYVTLYASTADPLSPVKRYHLELSVNPFFSPILAKQSLQGSGGIIQWSPQVALQDSTAYFWRVAVDSLDHPEGITDWRSSSFTYIQGKTGWSQSHFDQILNADYHYLDIDTVNQSLSFVDDQHELVVQTGIHPGLAANQHFYSLNGTYKHQGSLIITHNLAGGFVFAVFDTLSSEPMKSVNTTASWNGPWGNYQDPASTRNVFEFPTHTPQWRDKLADFFDSIPSGYYVLGYSIKNHHADEFPEALYQRFEGIGSATIRTLQPGIPYIIFGRKGATIGDPAIVKEISAAGPSDTVRLVHTLTNPWHTGSITSVDVGPASHWFSAHWKQLPFGTDPTNTDSVRITITALDKNGNTFSFPSLTNILPYPDSLVNLSAVVDASIFPWIRIKMDVVDMKHRTPAQLKSWMVLYTPVGETALDPPTRFTFHQDTITQGDSLKFSVATRNISPYPMDSLLVFCRVTDSERKVHFPTYKRFQTHQAGDTLIIQHIHFSTSGMAPGPASLWLEVNPVNPLTGIYDQPEQTHINNVGEKAFLIVADHQNPLLDVTFDGVHILDGDLVSAKPAIEIQLTDENMFFMFDQPGDTALFRIYLKAPLSNEFRQIFFRTDGADQMIFYPAAGKHNSCRILFPADFSSQDGTYVLRIEATDKSMGTSGAIQYQISFKVIGRSSITEVLNWPNPFSTRTHFVFTLTGYEAPSDFRIQIMTISGKVIRELTLQDLGNIHPGRNITSGYWDGTDEFGDRVANGIYLYRVIATLRGQSVEKTKSPADQYFHEGWGKMYLMR